MMVDQRQEKGEYIQWRPEESKLLIELVASCFKEGWVDPNGKMFKKTVETKIISVLNEKFNSRKTYKNFINRMKILKNQYRNFVNLLHFDSKVQWNPITKKFMAPDEVWNAYLRVSFFFLFFVLLLRVVILFYIVDNTHPCFD